MASMPDVKPAQLCCDDSCVREPLWLKKIYNKGRTLAEQLAHVISTLSPGTCAENASLNLALS